jgi:RecA-family ATPase
MKLVNQYKSYVSGKLDFAEALQEHLGNKKYLTPAVIEELAEAHAEAYGEKYRRTIFCQPTRQGTWCFYTDESCTREFRDDTALRQWQRDVEPYQQVKKQTSKTTRKSVDPIQAEATRLGNKFSKTEIKRLIKVLTANV